MARTKKTTVTSSVHVSKKWFKRRMSPPVVKNLLRLSMDCNEVNEKIHKEEVGYLRWLLRHMFLQNEALQKKVDIYEEEGDETLCTKCDSFEPTTHFNVCRDCVNGKNPDVLIKCPQCEEMKPEKEVNDMEVCLECSRGNDGLCKNGCDDCYSEVSI